MSILVNQLTKIYGEQKAVNSIQFEIPKGQIVGFLGPNGAGKSTTMKMLTGFIPPTSGQAMVNGFDIQTDPLQVKASVGYLPEHNPLYKDMYVQEYLQFVANVFKINNSKSRIAEMIERTGLTPERKKKIGQLSKGYRQRVGLAQAMLHDPQTLILDEPTSGLDPNQLVDIRQLIKDIGAEKTVMLSTHIMQEVEAMCDRVIIINKGQIVADDTTSNLQAAHLGQQQLTVKFKERLPKDALSQLKAEVQMISDQEWVLTAKSNVDLGEMIFSWAKTKGYTVVGMQQNEQNLEDVFKQLTQKK